MDYLFIPGSTPAENLGKTYFSKRPGTTLITPSRGNLHVAGFLAKLGAGAPVTLPIGDLILTAHGNETGKYGIPLSRTIAAPADFEVLVTADSTNAIRIPVRLVTDPADGTVNTITLRLHGCNIGKAQPFVAKFQTAMTPTGGSLNLVAPLHFDELQEIRGGCIEFLAHKFTLSEKQKFVTSTGADDRPALLAAFDAAGFTYLDGTKIPTASWDTWVPSSIHPPPSKWKQEFPMNVDLSPDVNGQTTIHVDRQYRFETPPPFTWSWAAPDPKDPQKRLDLLKSSLPQGTLNGLHMYDPAYDWPIYARVGFTDIDDFVDNLNWKVTFSGGKLHYSAQQFLYTVVLPITDPPVPPANPALKLYNFFPKTAATGPAVMNLDESNTDLFINI